MSEDKLAEFVKVVEGLGITVHKSKRDRYSWRKPEVPCDPFIQIEWSTGGVSGGSCWDTSDPRPYTNDDPEPEFTDLDKILESICPNITFLQYKNLMAAGIIERSNRVEHEYYGNQTDYSAKTVDLKKLYNELVERGFIQ